VIPTSDKHFAQDEAGALEPLSGCASQFDIQLCHLYISFPNVSGDTVTQVFPLCRSSRKIKVFEQCEFTLYSDTVGRNKKDRRRKAMAMQFCALGVGGAFSNKYYSTSVAVLSDKGALLIDCPHPIRKMLGEASLPRPTDAGDFDAVLISHLHADHSSGIEGLLYFSKFHIGRRAVLAAHPKVLERLWPNHLSGGMDTLDVNGDKKSFALEDYAEIIPLSEERRVQIGAFEVVCRRTLHHIPTFAFKIFADSRSLGYSADTEYDETLIDWLKECDVILHETNEGIHTPYEKLVSLDASIRNKMRLIHYPDHFDLKNALIEPLIQGCTVKIP
jgi:phosphoribosyl 1,2-cyclic phosphodiesterase